MKGELDDYLKSRLDQLYAELRVSWCYSAFCRQQRENVVERDKVLQLMTGPAVHELRATVRLFPERHRLLLRRPATLPAHQLHNLHTELWVHEFRRSTLQHQCSSAEPWHGQDQQEGHQAAACPAGLATRHHPCR